MWNFPMNASGRLPKKLSRQETKQCCGVFLLEIVDAKSVSGSLHQNPVAPLLQDVFVRICASAASRATCARPLYAGLLSKISLSGSLRQDPIVGPVVQDLCMRVSCARCLRSPQQNPVEVLAQDRCMRISCARCLRQDLSRTTCARSLYADILRVSLCQDLSIRILYDHSVCGSLAQDLCVRIFASGSCRTSCARSLYEDLLPKVFKISSQNPVGALVQDRCMRILCKMSVSRSPRIL